MPNEAEASLHPDLIAPLARLIGTMAARAQVVVVSHAPALVEAIDQMPGARRFTLDKRLGEIVVVGEAARVDMDRAMRGGLSITPAKAGSVQRDGQAPGRCREGLGRVEPSPAISPR